MWFEDFRGAWTVLSYMYVLEVHTGATLRVGFFRMIGTFLGAVAAFVVRDSVPLISSSTVETANVVVVHADRARQPLCAGDTRHGMFRPDIIYHPFHNIPRRGHRCVSGRQIVGARVVVLYRSHHSFAGVSLFRLCCS
jgi:hypothetical protein